MGEVQPSRRAGGQGRRHQVHDAVLHLAQGGGGGGELEEDRDCFLFLYERVESE